MDKNLLLLIAMVLTILGFLTSYFIFCYFDQKRTKNKFLENFDIEEDIYSYTSKKKVLKIKADMDYKQKEDSYKERLSISRTHERN